MFARRVVGFLLQNPIHPTWPMLYTNLANSGKIKLRFEEIQWDLDHIWWDLARFGQIQVDFGDFQCRSSEFLQISVNFLKISMMFAASATLSTDRTDLNMKPIRLIEVGGWFQVPLPPTRRWWVRSRLGPKLTHPDPWTTLVIVMNFQVFVNLLSILYNFYFYIFIFYLS